MSLSSDCQGGPFQRHQCCVRVHGPFEMSHPKVTSRVYFLHLSALWETLFSPDIWHFLILACFPGQQPWSPALPAIQQRRVRCCHCLCACLPSCSAWLLHGQLRQSPGATHTLRVRSATVVPAKTPQSHDQHTHCWSQKLAGGEWFKARKPGMARISHWALQVPSIYLPGHPSAMPMAVPCLPVLHRHLCFAQTAATTAEFKAGQSSTIKERDQHGARQHPLQKTGTTAMRATKPQPARSEALLHWAWLLAQNC